MKEFTLSAGLAALISRFLAVNIYSLRKYEEFFLNVPPEHFMPSNENKRFDRNAFRRKFLFRFQDEIKEAYVVYEVFEALCQLMAGGGYSASELIETIKKQWHIEYLLDLECNSGGELEIRTGVDQTLDSNGCIDSDSVEKLNSMRKSVEESSKLRLFFKSQFLADQSEKVFLSAQIYSDIRPIFDTSRTEPTEQKNKFDLVDAIIKHSLKIDFLNNANWEQVFIAMDIEDILNLKDVLDRAIAKHDAIISLNSLPRAFS